ncbi:MAG: hypothetical protein WCD47_21495 [Candidatus Sulfotelmatobacter sp.]
MPEPGVMLAGEKEQLIVLGMPLQLSAIALLNDPDCGFAVAVRLPVAPAEIVRDAGDALKDSVGFGVGGGAGEGGEVGWAAAQVAVKLVAPLIWLASVGLPTACTNIL